MNKEKEKIYNKIEDLIRKSFEEGTEDIEQVDEDGTVDPYKLIHHPEYDFKSTYLVRSKCFWNINHFLQYVKSAIEEA